MFKTENMKIPLCTARLEGRNREESFIILKWKEHDERSEPLKSDGDDLIAKQVAASSSS